MLQNKKVSVIIPTYNERENIVECIQRISNALDGDLFEIIVVDDNSPDGTAHLVQTLKYHKVKLIVRTTESGLASAIALGISKAGGDYICWLDSDLGIPPEELTHLIHQLPKFDLAIGSRYVGIGKDTRHAFRAFISVVICQFANLVLGLKVKDATSGFAAAKKEVFARIPFPKEGFGQYFPEFLYYCRQRNISIIEVGYVFGYRKGGKSKCDSHWPTFFKLGLQYCFNIIKLKFSTPLAKEAPEN